MAANIVIDQLIARRTIAAAAYQMSAAASTLGNGEKGFSAVSKAMEELTGVSLKKS